MGLALAGLIFILRPWHLAGTLSSSFLALAAGFCWGASAVLVKRQAMLDIGLFDSRYTTTDDFDAWLKILWKI